MNIDKWYEYYRDDICNIIYKIENYIKSNNLNNILDYPQWKHNFVIYLYNNSFHDKLFMKRHNDIKK